MIFCPAPRRRGYRNSPAFKRDRRLSDERSAAFFVLTCREFDDRGRSSRGVKKKRSKGVEEDRLSTSLLLFSSTPLLLRRLLCFLFTFNTRARSARVR